VAASCAQNRNFESMLVFGVFWGNFGGYRQECRSFGVQRARQELGFAVEDCDARVVCIGDWELNSKLEMPP
jgi:hypothetical protein